MENNRNTFLAIALSFAVLFGWQYLYVGPARQKARLQEVNETLRNAAKPSPNASNLQASPANSPAVQQPSGAGIAFASREEAIAATPRVALTTPELKGSINLKGGRIVYVVLRGTTETVNPDSPKVVLLSPSSSPHPYFALTGWLAPSGTPVPDSNTVW